MLCTVGLGWVVLSLWRPFGLLWFVRKLFSVAGIFFLVFDVFPGFFPRLSRFCDDKHCWCFRCFFCYFGFGMLFFCFCTLLALLPLSWVNNFLGIMFVCLSAFSLCLFCFFLSELYAILIWFCVNVCRCIFGVFAVLVPVCSPPGFLCVFLGLKCPYFMPRVSTRQHRVHRYLLFCCVFFFVYFAYTTWPNSRPQRPPVPPRASFPCPTMPLGPITHIPTLKYPPWVYIVVPDPLC